MKEFIKDNHIFLAKTYAGLEEVLVKEMQDLKYNNITPVKRGVQFTGDKYTLYKANYQLRTALRILAPIHEFTAFNEKQLYDGVQEIDWSSFMDVKSTFAIHATLMSEKFTHSHFVSLKTKDAIVDQFRTKTGVRPSIDTANPDFSINVHIHHTKVTISLDSSGESLHIRGYKKEAKEAPISEVLAAGLIKMSGWNIGDPFIDFMCGSGTILSEAALMAYNVCPGLFRAKFAFEKWQNYDDSMFERIKENAKNQEKDSYDGFIGGCDHSPSAVRIAQKNMTDAAMDFIDIQISDFKNYAHNFDRGTVLINPPYGERLAIKDAEELYKEIGDTFKNNYKGFKCWMITSSMEGLKSVGLKPFKKYNVINGKLECKFYGYDIYAGSKKAKFNPMD